MAEARAQRSMPNARRNVIQAKAAERALSGIIRRSALMTPPAPSAPSSKLLPPLEKMEKAQRYLQAFEHLR